MQNISYLSVQKLILFCRIQELLPGEEIISKLPEFINSKWVLINGNPEYAVVRKRTFLPNWVATAICNVLYCKWHLFIYKLHKNVFTSF